MMKQLRVRVWERSESKMHYQVGMLSKDDGTIDRVLLDSERTKYVGSGCVVMLATGFQDKTGKEIFESDILRIELSFTDPEPTQDTVVTWAAGAFYDDRDRKNQLSALFDRFSNRVTVIGNMYDDPELMPSKRN